MVIETDIPPPVKTDPAHASFLRAARAGNLEKVVEYLKSSIDINHSNANGLNALHLAAKEGYADIVRLLIRKGAKVNSSTVKGNTALHIASLGGHVDVVKILLEEGADINCRSKAGFTALYMASQEDRYDVVQLLLSKGANQSIGTDDGFTPLAVSLQQGHDRIVSLLLQYDAKGKVRLPPLHIAAKKDDVQSATLLLSQAEQQGSQLGYSPVDQPSKSGFTALHIAAHYGNERVARLLLQHGAQVNICARHLITPIHVASKWGQLRMVELLVKCNANVAAVTRDGLSALHCAARSGHEHVVRYLLHDCGVPAIQLCSLKTKSGLTPLHMAAQGDHVGSAKALLDAGSFVDEVTGDYLTALHVASHCGHVGVAKLLLDNGADVNARALNGFSPLHIASKKNRIKVVELLLKYGANIEATTESGLTPIHAASFMGCLQIVILLLQRGAYVDSQTVRGETALHLAVRSSQLEIVLILLRNKANVNSQARENQTPLHIASRVGNLEIIQTLLDNGADINAQTSHLFTPLLIACKENQEETVLLLLERGADINKTTKSDFTGLHLTTKYGNIKIAKLLIAKNIPINYQGKNNLTALHIAAHYDRPEIALLLLSHGADAKMTARNGYTALHIACKRGQLEICIALLEYGCPVNSPSKAGFSPIHLAVQNGHSDVVSLLIQQKADVNAKAKNGLTCMHLCAQEDRVNIAMLLLKNKAEINEQTKNGFTPLHVAAHFGKHNMIQFLLSNGAQVHSKTQQGFTPLHSASQQGHAEVVSTLLNKDSSVANQKSSDGQTALRIAQRLGYSSVVSTLIEKTTETMVLTETSEESRYKVEVPEEMHETFFASDSEDEHAAADFTHTEQMRYMNYLTTEDGYHNSSANLDGSKDHSMDAEKISRDFASLLEEEPNFSPSHYMMTESYMNTLAPDNVDLTKSPTIQGKLKWKSFLVSFMVDARGGAMRGCRHSGVRILIPPRKASQPMRVTCKYVRKEKLLKPPPLLEGEECASRILELSPPGVKFLGPVIIEVPHFASLRNQEREILILRSDNGETWKEHAYLTTPEAVEEILQECFSGEADMTALNSDYTPSRITRILTTDFPNYFALITRIKQDVQSVGADGGVLNSSICQQVQAIFPPGSLTKRIKVGLQSQPIPSDLVSKIVGNGVACSPIVTVEPRRRKFHKAITLQLPLPIAGNKGMINEYKQDAPSLRLLFSLTGGSNKAVWEDLTGSTQLSLVNNCVQFNTTVSARFWLIDCRQIQDSLKIASLIYQKAVEVPFLTKFVIFCKQVSLAEYELRMFILTDDKEEKTLEQLENYVEIAKSKLVEINQYSVCYLEFAGNFKPIANTSEQLQLRFEAFHENRLACKIKIKELNSELVGRVAFMREKRRQRTDLPQTPICNLNIILPHDPNLPEEEPPKLSPKRDLSPRKLNGFTSESSPLKKSPYESPSKQSNNENYALHPTLAKVANQLNKDWDQLAAHLNVPENLVDQLANEPDLDNKERAAYLLQYWQNNLNADPKNPSENVLENALRRIGREDIIYKAILNIEQIEELISKPEIQKPLFADLNRQVEREATTYQPFAQEEIDEEVEQLDDTQPLESQAIENIEFQSNEPQRFEHQLENQYEEYAPQGQFEQSNQTVDSQSLLRDNANIENQAPIQQTSRQEIPDNFIESHESIENTDTDMIHTVKQTTKTTIISETEEPEGSLIDFASNQFEPQDLNEINLESQNISSTFFQKSQNEDDDLKMHVEQNEWFEQDNDGTTHHIIEQKTVCTTLESESKFDQN